MHIVEKFAGHEWHAETCSAHAAIARQYVEKMTMECGGTYRIREIDCLDINQSSFKSHLTDFRPLSY